MKLNGFYGAGSGRLGEAVASNGSNGATIWRKYQPKVNQPNTKEQMLVRAKFAKIASVGTQLKPALRYGMKHGKMYRVSEVNAFVKKNYDKVSGTTPENVAVDFLELELSNPAAGIFIDEVGQPDFSERGKVEGNFSFDIQEVTPMYPDVASAEVVAVVYNSTLNRCCVGTSNATVGSYSVNIPQDWSGTTAYVYLFIVAKSATLGLLPSYTVMAGTGNLS